MEIRTIVDPHPRTTRNEAVTRWSRGARAALGVLTLALVTTVALGAGGAVLGLTTAGSGSGPFAPIQYVLFIAMIVHFLLTAFYVSFAAQNPRTDRRGTWIAGIVLLPWAAQPLYWWVHVWGAPYAADPTQDYNVPGGQADAPR